jgi:hypothetical protein
MNATTVSKPEIRSNPMNNLSALLVALCLVLTFAGCKSPLEKCTTECGEVYSECLEKNDGAPCGELHSSCLSRCNIEDLMRD